MKKVLSLILVAVMLFSTVAMITSCSSEDKLVMATNAAFPPYEYKDGKKIVGIDAEIAEAIAAKLGKKLVIKDVDFGSIIAGVQTGKYDFGMAGLTVTDERKEQVNFSETYATGVQVFIVKIDSKYTSIDDFFNYDAEGNPVSLKDENVKIGVQESTTGDIYSSDDVEKWGFGENRVTRYKTGAEAVEALKKGSVDAVIIDNEPAKSFVKQNADSIKILETEYAYEDYAIAVNKADAQLLADINKALAELKADGTLDAIIKKYIPAE